MIEVLLTIFVCTIAFLAFAFLLFISFAYGEKMSTKKDANALPLRKRHGNDTEHSSQERINIILQNIENYDGTGANQKELR